MAEFSSELFKVLSKEEDIFFAVINRLDLSSLINLEDCCKDSRKIYKELEVYQKVFKKISVTRYMGTDWDIRLPCSAWDQKDFKKALSSIDRLSEQWKKGPLRVTTLSLERESVSDLVMDERSIAVATRSGRIYLYSRETLKHVLTLTNRNTRTAYRIGLSRHFVLSGPALVGRWDNEMSIIDIWCRKTGRYVHSFYLHCNYIHFIVSGAKNLILVSQSISEEIARRANFVTVHKVSGKSSENSTQFYRSTKSTELYKLEVTVKRNCLSQCQTKYLAYTPSCPDVILMVEMETGETLTTIDAWRAHLNPNGSAGLDIVDFGFVTSGTIFFVTDFGGRTTSMRLLEISGDQNGYSVNNSGSVFSPLRYCSNWQVLIPQQTISLPGSRTVIGPCGETMRQADFGLGLSTEGSSIEHWTDTTSIIYYLRKKASPRLKWEYALVIQDYVTS